MYIHACIYTNINTSVHKQRSKESRDGAIVRNKLGATRESAEGVPGKDQRHLHVCVLMSQRLVLNNNWREVEDNYVVEYCIGRGSKLVGLIEPESEGSRVLRVFHTSPMIRS